jgi:hypothetical protein
MHHTNKTKVTIWKGESFHCKKFNVLPWWLAPANGETLSDVRKVTLQQCTSLESLNDYFIPDISLVLFYLTFQSTVGTTRIMRFNIKELSTPLGYNITLCSSKTDRLFGATNHLHLQRRRLSQARNQQAAGGRCLTTRHCTYVIIYVCVSYDSQNTQRLFLQKALINWAL